jgi:hypothetical protein
MNQNIWGSHLWFSLHTMSFNYPLKPTNEEKEEYKQFFIYLQYVIPCSKCKKNYQRHLKEHPIDSHLENRKKLVYWVIDIHNMVNGEIGKKILSYDIVIKKYEEVYKKRIILEDDQNDDDTNHNIIYKKGKLNTIINIILVFFLFLLIINLVILFYNKST